MQDRTVSVVIPTHNYGQYVTEAVEGVLSQTFRDYEIIVVDDGSTDDTRERLEPYMGRIRYMYQKNRGISAARNVGIRAARGRYIAFLDADDVWLPEKLARETAFLEEHGEVGLVASLSLGSEDGMFQATEPEQETGQPGPRYFTAKDFLLRSRFAPSGVTVRRSCFETVGMFDETIFGAEDVDMWVRIAQVFPVVRLEEALWQYRVHGGSFSTKLRKMERAKTEFLRKVFRSRDFRGQLLLRLQVYSELYFERAYLLGHVEGKRFRAACQLVLSGLLWPGRLGPWSRKKRLIRLKSFVHYVLGSGLFHHLKGRKTG